MGYGDGFFSTAMVGMGRFEMEKREMDIEIKMCGWEIKIENEVGEVTMEKK